MPRSQYFVGLTLIVASALAIFIMGWMLGDSRATSDAPTVLDQPTAGSDGLPEVVVTAPRPGSQAVALSESEAAAAATTPPGRPRHR